MKVVCAHIISTYLRLWRPRFSQNRLNSGPKCIKILESVFDLLTREHVHLCEPFILQHEELFAGLIHDHELIPDNIYAWQCVCLQQILVERVSVAAQTGGSLCPRSALCVDMFTHEMQRRSSRIQSLQCTQRCDSICVIVGEQREREELHTQCTCTRSRGDGSLRGRHASA